MVRRLGELSAFFGEFLCHSKCQVRGIWSGFEATVREEGMEGGQRIIGCAAKGETRELKAVMSSRIRVDLVGWSWL